MKIVRITTLLDFGGQEKKYISFTSNVSQLENEYVFAAIGYGGYAEKILKSRGFEVEIFNQNPKITNLKNIWILYKWFKKIKPNIVHTAAAEANFHATIAAKLAGVKTIIAEEIGFPSHSYKAKIIFKYVYKLCNTVICVSKAVQNYLIEIKEIHKNQSVVIYNPVTSPINVSKSSSPLFTIVTVGRLEKIKNQQLLIHAFAQLNPQNTKLYIVGDGRERNNLEGIIKQYNLNNKIIITGFSSTPQEYLAQANLFVLPSLSEGFGIAAVEAMQYEVPCLCSNVGGIPEFIEDGVTGWLFNPNNENEFREKLETIVNKDLQILKAIGIAGKEKIKNMFTEEQYVNNLQKLYKTFQ